MGGYGSGGHNKTHSQLEDFHRIDSFAFYHHLMGDKYLCYKNTVKYYDIVYHVPSETAVIRNYSIRYKEYRYLDLSLSRVPGIDGKSVRMYFHCPYCGQRVRYLYDFQGHYVCRHCLNANYRIQQTSGMDKLRLKMFHIVAGELEYTGWDVDYPDVFLDDLLYIPKPRYMRWDKYERHMQELRNLQRAYKREFFKGLLKSPLIPDDMAARISEQMTP